MVLGSSEVVLRGVIIKHTLAATDACVASRAVHYSVSIGCLGLNCLPLHFVLLSRVTLIEMIDQMGLQIHQLGQAPILSLRDGSRHR